MLLGEVQRREERIATIRGEVTGLQAKISALDAAMALADSRLNPGAAGAVRATSERYEGRGGLLKFLLAEITAAGATGLDTKVLSLRAACRFDVPLDSQNALHIYSDTVSYALRTLRTRNLIENGLYSRGGHRPAVWRIRSQSTTFAELLVQRPVSLETRV